MTDQEFKALKATMPWREQNFMRGRYTHIQIIDRHGNEVKLLTLIAFLVYISQKLGQREAGNAEV